MLTFGFGTSVSAGPIKVAFVADQGIDSNAQAVLSLIASEGTDLVLIQGDLGYIEGAASAWESNLTTALGEDFPVLAVIGNHEDTDWPTYQSLIQQRVERANELTCNGQIGTKATCQYRNIDIVQVSPGIHNDGAVEPDDNYADYIDSSFPDADLRWRICSWHKNQNKMQTGEKPDETGWGVYTACLNAGALIATGHEHAYSRTYLLSDFSEQTIVHKNSEMHLKPGQSFAFVSGLGGWQVRRQVEKRDWWASIYTSTQEATHGALFCNFDETTADCYFKAIDGAIPDQFSLTLTDDPAPQAVESTPEPVVEAPTEVAESESILEPVASAAELGPEPAMIAAEPVPVFVSTEPQALAEPVAPEPEITQPIAIEAEVLTDGNTGFTMAAEQLSIAINSSDPVIIPSATSVALAQATGGSNPQPTASPAEPASNTSAGVTSLAMLGILFLIFRLKTL